MPGELVPYPWLLLGSVSTSSAANTVHLLVHFVALVLRGGREVGGVLGQGGGLRRIRFSSRDWIIGAGKWWRYYMQAVGRERVAAQLRPPYTT